MFWTGVTLATLLVEVVAAAKVVGVCLLLIGACFLLGR